MNFLFFNLYYILRLFLKWVVTGKKDLRYYATERLAKMFNPHFHFTESGQIWRTDKKFEDYYVGFEGDNLSMFGFVKWFKGWIPDRFPETAGVKFCFVHIDVDLYQPTLDSISFFNERLNIEGS